MKNIIWIVLIFLGVGIQLFGQKQTYYYGPNTRHEDGLEKAFLYKDVNKKSDNKYVIKTFQKVGSEWERVLKEKIKIKKNGDQVIWQNANNFFSKKSTRKMEEINPNLYQFEVLKRERTVKSGTTTKYLPLHLEGVITEYHPNGQVKSISNFHDNQLIANENWLSDGSKYIDSLFYSTDKGPVYKYGNAYFKGYLIEKLAESKIDFSQIDDEIVIGWVVMETGKIDGVIALQGKSTELNQFLIEAISKIPGSWEPAILNGSAVRYFMTIPLNISQNKTMFQELELSSGILYFNAY